MSARTTLLVASVVATSSLGVLPNVSMGQGQPQTNVIYKSATTSAGEPLVFPTQNVEVTGSIGVRPPGWVGEWHKHPYPRIHYILEGTFTVEYENGETKNFPAGSLSVEPVNVWHRPKNVGNVAAKWLFVDAAESGKPNVTPQAKP